MKLRNLPRREVQEAVTMAGPPTARDRSGPHHPVALGSGGSDDALQVPAVHQQ